MAVSVYIPTNRAKGLGKIQLELNLKMVNAFKRRLSKGLNCVHVYVHTRTHTFFFPKYFREFHHFFFFLTTLSKLVLLRLWYALKSSQSTIPPFRFSQSGVRPGSKHSQEVFPFLRNSGTWFIFFFLFSKGERYRLSSGLSAFLHPELGHMSGY